ncbi:hypothetical protein OM258_17935 [Escherichia albertii]|nr:hypothetical protein [Escherichia albertii]
MANCNDYISADDLKTGKQAILHIEHVAKSRDANGNHSAEVTDEIRGEQITNPTLDGFFSSITLKPVDGSFEDGGVLRHRWETLLYKTNRSFYQWLGDLPKTVPAGSSPFDESGQLIMGWRDATDLSQAAVNKNTYKPLFIHKETGSFTSGGKAISKISALYNPQDEMYYTPKTGSVTVLPGSVPDSSWVCVGILGRYEIGDLRNFKAVGDGVSIDTQSFILAMTCANFFKNRVIVPGGYTFVCDKMQFSNINNVTIEGTGCIKMISERTGAFYYADGAQITFINSSNVKIIGIEFDGNRSGSPQYTGFNHGIQFVTGTGDFRSNNGGDVKKNKNIYISKCRFHDQGSYNSGIDKFGDGIYLFGCDGVVIENNEFVDIGRWGVASSDCFNVRIINNYHNCSKIGTVALGFVDIENESTDNTNGSYSHNIVISGNTICGFGQILVSGGNNSENNLGAKHYLRNVTITGNSLLIESNTHETASYMTNLVFIGVAPFCNVVPTTSAQAIDNSNIVISNNTLKCYIPSNLSIGTGISGQGTGFSSGIFNTVNGVVIKNNTIFGFEKGIQAESPIVSTGYTFTNVLIANNTIDCNGLTNSIGIRTASTQLVGVSIQSNIIRNAVTRGISVEDGREIGAIDSYVMISDNEVYSNIGTNYFANIYRASFQGNGSRGGALVLDATVTNMDKDYGNTWNHILREINGFTVNSMSQITQDAIDIGSQTRFGYTVQLIPPFNLEGAQSSAMVTGPGLARAFITNMSGSPVTKATDIWHMVVEKH